LHVNATLNNIQPCQDTTATA